MRKPVPFAVVVAIAGLLVWAFLREGGDETLRPLEQPRFEETGVALGSTGMRATSSAESGRVLVAPAVEGAKAEASEPIVGYVVDRFSGEPVIAQVAVGDERFVTTASGAFALSPKLRGASARFEADGYRSRSVVVPAASPLTVELEPEEVVRVRVVSPSRSPVAGVTVEFVAAEWPRSGARPVLASLSTDSEGLVEFPSRIVRVARLVDSLGAGVQVRPGETRTIVADPPGAGLRFLDVETGQPVAGVRVRVHPARADRLAARVVETSESGEVSLAAHPLGYELDLLDEHVAWAEPVDPPAIERTWGGVHVPGADAEHEPTTLYLEVERAMLLLTDAATGEPIDGTIEATVTTASRTEPIPPGFFESFPVRDGRFSLQRFSASKLADPRLWCAIRAPGYVLTDVADLARAYAMAPEPLRVELEPARTRRLRFVDRAGAPFISGIYVSDGEWLRDLFFGRPDDLDGVVEVDWGGGDLIVWRPAKRADRDAVNGRTRLARVPASLLEERKEVVVVLADEAHGNVVVTGAPAGAAMHAIDAGGRRAVAVTGDDGRARLGSFPPGRLLVGTRAWVDHNEANFRVGFFPDALRVAPGRTLRVPYERRWRLESPIHGRIALDAVTLAEAVVLPEYTTKPGGAPPSRPSLELRLDEDGRYTIPAGDPRPERLAVWVREHVDPAVAPLHDRYLAAWVDVGTEAVPALGALEVFLPDDSELESVAIEWTHRDLRSDRGETVHATLERGERLGLPGLPVGELRIRCTAFDRSWTVTERVRPGSVRVLKVKR